MMMSEMSRCAQHEESCFFLSKNTDAVRSNQML